MNVIKKSLGDCPLAPAAISIEDMNMIRFLISEGSDIEGAGRQGFTPLMHARTAMPPDFKIIDLIESLGAGNPFASR